MIDLMEEIKERKILIESEIEELFDRDEQHPLWELMAVYPKAGGKKLRPFLAMISAGALGIEEKKALPLGISMELIHNFTLVHDDIMDKDPVRRGIETIYKREGVGSAINVGDALFALAFKVLSHTELEGDALSYLLDEVADSVLKVAEGQDEDMRFESTYDITEEEFINMIEKKTSHLFQACTKGAAIIAGAPEEHIQRMGEYARKMGIAFQLQDDYLDLVGDQDEIGKPVCSDIRSGKRTFIIIHALQNLENPERLKNLLDKEKNTEDEIEEVLSLLKNSSSLEHCKMKARRYAHEAKREIRFIQDTYYKEILEDLVDLMIRRTN